MGRKHIDQTDKIYKGHKSITNSSSLIRQSFYPAHFSNGRSDSLWVASRIFCIFRNWNNNQLSDELQRFSDRNSQIFRNVTQIV